MQSTKIKTCKTCGGKGKVMNQKTKQLVKCQACRGTGKAGDYTVK